MKNQQKHEHDHGGIERQKHGISSFDMQDSKPVFCEFKLSEGSVFLDLGCGAGDYAICASRLVGDSGVVYALDRWKEVTSVLAKKALSLGLRNIKTIQSDLLSFLPLKDKSIDSCLIAHVLHGLDIHEDTKILFTEICRVLKPGGRLAVMEFKKKDVGFGPPMRIRLSPEEIEDVASRYYFKKVSLIDFEYSYLLQFEVK